MDTRARAQTDSLIGEVLASRYKIENRLGEGAMGVVYKARHVKVGRPFAVKVLHPNLLTDNKVEQRFEREAELAGRLRHPNVIGVVDVGETADGFRYMVMDYVEGRDLAALLVEAPMPPQRIIRLVRQMLEGLYHAHQNGLIHRDFKPENVIVERDTHGDEVPRIVDFGIAILREGGDSPDSPGRLTTNGLVLGTPHYMAPEQAVADPVDHRIDLFALGIVIYEMLSGKLPFDGNGAEVARANLMLDPPPIAKRVPFLEVDPLLEAFARRLLEKKRDMRPPTAKAARELLDLIERDRAAAAAALGVPLDVGTRPPAVTAPVAPRKSESLAELHDAEAPPMPKLVAVSAHVPPVSAREISTDRVSDPLPHRRGNHGIAIVAGVAALAIVAVAGVLIVGGGGGDDSKVAATESKPAAAPPPDPVVEAKPPAPVVDEPPPAVVDDKPAPPPVDEKPAPPKPQPAKHPAPKPKQPALKSGPVTKPSDVKPAEVKPPEPKPADVKPPETKPIEVKPPEPKPAEIKPEPKPPEPKPAEAKPALTPASVTTLFGEVGAEIIKFNDATSGGAKDLLKQWRNIDINRDAKLKTEQTAALLYKLRAALAERKKH